MEIWLSKSKIDLKSTHLPLINAHKTIFKLKESQISIKLITPFINFVYKQIFNKKNLTRTSRVIENFSALAKFSFSNLLSKCYIYPTKIISRAKFLA